MADLRKHSNTSNLIRFTLKNSSTGVGLTGLSSASSGLIISTICDNEATATVYTVAASNVETITTLGTYAAPTASKCRFKEVDATNHKGLYEFQFADARFSVASAKRLVISVTGATNLLDADYEIQLLSFDPYVAIAQTGDGYAVVNHASYGNAKLVRSTTPANTLDVSATGEAGLDFNNINQAAGATTLNNYTIPTVTTLTNAPSDSSGVTTLLTRIASALTITIGKVDVNDKTGFSLSTAGIQAIWDALTSTLITVGSVGKLLVDNVNATISSRSSHTAADVWAVGTRTLTSFGTLVVDIWANSTRTLTAFSTGLALSVWDVLESAIATANSIGLKLKTNLDATVSSRLPLSGYTAPDNAGISSILSESQSHPTLAEIEASTVLAKEATSALIKTKTDTIVWTDITDIKDESLGKWSINKTTNVLTMYRADGVTVLKQFNLTDNASVSERVPV